MPDYDFSIVAAAVVGDEDNRILNPTFEVDASNWESNTAFGTYVAATLARSTAHAATGVASLRATWPSAPGGKSWANHTVISTTPGAMYRMTAKVWVPSGSPDVRCAAVFRAAGTAWATTKDAWVEISMDFEALDDTIFVGIECESPTAGQTCYIDDVSFVQTSPVTLGFNTKITKDTPMERATAQFRKDQLDSTATAGDQSLTGWWTRGQFSFHKGAGVKYYEVLGNEDDTIESRFHDSVGVDPWAPGEVVLADGFSAASKTTIVDMVRFENEGVLALLSSGGLWQQTGASGAVKTPAFSANPIVSITQTQGVVFATDGTDIAIVRPGRFSFAQSAPGRTWESIWNLKDRIFAVDDSGRWHTFTNYAGGTVAAADADAFWNAGVLETPASWSAADSPASIYLARSNKIYNISLDTDGLVPTVTFAGTAAQLPNGEIVSTIEYYLGWLVIGTNLGVRAARVQADGSLVLGPRFIRGDFSARACIATSGDCAYITGVADGDTSASMFEVNLSESVTDVTPGWTSRISDLDPSGPTGAMEGADGLLYAFDAVGFRYGTGAPADSGTLTTGFHRYGTLEPKSFRSLRVKTEGTEGDIDVTVSTPNGTTYTVGTVAAGAAEEFDLSAVSGFPSALEYLSITFTLNRGTTEGPTLLGYQLKALPVPRRQRMIRVPLALFDREENRTGQTILGDPWTRLAALEALEESNAVVSFEDRETGETGSAYIESVEVTRTAPAQGGKGGFGGTIFLTLRRL